VAVRPIQAGLPAVMLTGAWMPRTACFRSMPLGVPPPWSGARGAADASAAASPTRAGVLTAWVPCSCRWSSMPLSFS